MFSKAGPIQQEIKATVELRLFLIQFSQVALSGLDFKDKPGQRTVFILADSARILKTKYKALAPHLNERSRRIFAAVEAQALGYGGVSLVAKITKVSRRAIHVGLREITSKDALTPERIRSPGGGRKQAATKDPALCKELESLVDPLTRGDPMSALRWTCKSTRTLSKELTKRWHPACAVVVAKILHEMDYSLQGNRKTQEGKQSQIETPNSNTLTLQQPCK